MTTHAWSRAEWVEASMPVWRTLVEPVAEGVGRAVGAALHTQLEQLGEGALPEGMFPPGVDPSTLIGQMEPMVAKMSGAMFGLQVGQAVGALATETVSGTEVGLPVVADRSVVLLPANVEAFADGLGRRPGAGAALPRRPGGRPRAPVQRGAVDRTAARGGRP